MTCTPCSAHPVGGIPEVARGKRVRYVQLDFRGDVNQRLGDRRAVFASYFFAGRLLAI